MNVDQAATLIGQSRRTVRRLARDGHFPGAYRRPTRLGGWVIPSSAIRAYLQAQALEGTTR